MLKLLLLLALSLGAVPAPTQDPVQFQGSDPIVSHCQYTNRALMDMPAGSPLRPQRLLEGELVVIRNESQDTDVYVVSLTYVNANGARGTVVAGAPRLAGNKTAAYLFEVGIVKVVNVTAAPARISGPSVTVGDPT